MLLRHSSYNLPPICVINKVPQDPTIHQSTNTKHNAATVLNTGMIMTEFGTSCSYRLLEQLWIQERIQRFWSPMKQQSLSFNYSMRQKLPYNTSAFLCLSTQKHPVRKETTAPIQPIISKTPTVTWTEMSHLFYVEILLKRMIMLLLKPLMI